MTPPARDPFYDWVKPLRRSLEQAMAPARDPFYDWVKPLRSLEEAMAPARRALDLPHANLQKFTQPIERLRRQLNGALAQLPQPAVMLRGLEGVGERFQRALEAAFPPNWQGLTDNEREAALDFGRETGINLVWAPRVEIVRELVSAEEDARDKLLLAREREILEDLNTCLGRVDHRVLQGDADLAVRSLAAYRDGHHSAGHALAASVLSGFVNEEFGFPRFKDARERFVRDDPNHVELGLARITIVLRTVGRSLHITSHLPGPGFNRHATAHGHVEQYTRVNALAALMLLVGVARELDYWFKRQDAERADADSQAA